MRVARLRLRCGAQARSSAYRGCVVARPRASLCATATACGAPAPAAPAAVHRIAARIAAVATNIQLFAGAVVKLAAVAMVVRRMLGARARLLRVAAQKALVFRVAVGVEHNSAPLGVHMARGRACVAERHRRNGRDQGENDDSPHPQAQNTVRSKVRNIGSAAGRVRSGFIRFYGSTKSYFIIG